MGKNRKLSAKQKEINKEYKKQRDRVKRLARNAKKQGYIFADELVPKIPKKKTEASVRKLERITAEKFKVKLKLELKVDIETGEILKTDRRRRRTKKEKTADSISLDISIPTYDTFYAIRDKIKALPEGKYIGYGRYMDLSDSKNKLLSLLDDAINDNEYEKYLHEHEYEILTHLDVLTFDSDQDRLDYALANAFDLIAIDIPEIYDYSAEITE